MTIGACGGDPPCWSHLFEDEVIQKPEVDAETAQRTDRSTGMSSQIATARSLRVVPRAPTSLDEAGGEVGRQPSPFTRNQR